MSTDATDMRTDACPSPPREEPDEAQPGNAEPQPAAAEEKVDEPPNVSSPQSEYKRRKPRGYTRAPRVPNGSITITGSSSIQIGSNITYYMNSVGNQDGNKETKETIVKCSRITKLLESKEPVDKEHINFVSTHVGTGWKNIGRLLNYSDGQIEQFFENHHVTGIKEVIYQLLLDWIQNEPEHATLNMLGDALWEAGQKDAVRRLALKLYN